MGNSIIITSDLSLELSHNVRRLLNDELNGLCKDAGRSGIAGFRRTISSDVSSIVRGATAGLTSCFNETTSAAGNFSLGDSGVWLGFGKEPGGGLSQFALSWSFIMTSGLSNMLFVLIVGEGGIGAGLFLRPLVCGFGLSNGELNHIIFNFHIT